MNSGKEFEACWKDSWEKTGYWFIRLIDSVKWGTGAGASFTPSNPCDCVGFSAPILFVLELKSTNGTGISFNPGNPLLKPENAKTNVMIKAGQCKSLLKFAEKDGVIAGFILNFRPRMLKTKSEPNETFFIFIEDFMKFATESGKSGINREDCHKIGVPILGEIKKVKYKYDIESFISDTTTKLFQMKPVLKETFLKGLENFIKRYK
jgi:penicillin-binding protein-related factor A (putative recombinase)